MCCLLVRACVVGCSVLFVVRCVLCGVFFLCGLAFLLCCSYCLNRLLIVVFVCCVLLASCLLLGFSYIVYCVCKVEVSWLLVVAC